MFYDNGLHFECNRCSDCCRLSPGVVYLSMDDLTNLSSCFKLSIREFIDKYCRWVMYYDGKEVLSLQETKNYDCILWSKEGCTAYGYRPVQCSTYPFWSWMLASKKDWDDCEKDCPGINKGKLWPVDEILEQKALYDSIKPVHKSDLDLE